MKVLYVSYDGMTDALGRSQVIPYLVGLSGRGYRIHILSCEKPYVNDTEIKEVSDIFSASGIHWTRLSFSSHPPVLSKLADLVKIRLKAISLHKLEQFDIVHCRSYIAALAGLHLKKKYNVRFIFDMRGFWANERIDGKMWNLSNPFHNLIYRYFKRKEREFFRFSDAVVSLTHNGKKIIGELFGEDIEKKTTVIPCCVDTELFSRENISDKEKHQVKDLMNIGNDDFVVSYLGSIGTWYLTDEMMIFFRRLKMKYAQARFLIISGDKPSLIKDRAKRHGISSDDLIIVKASRNQVPVYLSLSHISIFFIKPVFSKKASSPTKQAEILSMGIPLICNAGVGDTDEIFKDSDAGIVINNFSEQEMDDAIARIENVLKTGKESIRSMALERFNLSDGIDRYEAIYRSVKVQPIS